ncbi:MAG: HDOD domain-containing protein [Thermodesulfobacteriota bacterium]
MLPAYDLPTKDATPAGEEKLRQIQSYISKMPSLSTTVMKVMEVCNKPNTSPNDLNRVISLDPVLTGRVLKLINSAYYALPNQITSLTRAIIMLGLNTVKNLALSAAILQSVGGKDSFRALSMDDFWTHSIAVGVTSKALSAQKRIPASLREEYFVSGMLHDLGKIPLSNRYPEEYLQAMDLARAGESALCLAEQQIFGVDHCRVGRMIAEKWELSGVLGDSLVHHHDPDQADAENRPVVLIVCLADCYTNAMAQARRGGGGPDDRRFNLLLEVSGISRESLEGLQETVLGEIEKAKVFLQVAGKG